jgi:outer membrane protein
VSARRRPARTHRVVCLLLAALVVAWADAASAGPPIAPGTELTLERAVEIALQYHPARKAAESQAQSARERVGEARSEILPQVFGVAEYLRATDNGIGDTAYLTAPGISRAPTTGRHVNQLTETFDNYTAGISAFQYLFDFGRARGLIAQRDAEADAQRARLRLVELDLVFEVSKAYFDLVGTREIVRVFEQAVKQRGAHLEEARVKSKAGLRPEIDTYTAQAELARTQLHLVDARNAAATAKVTLDTAMGLGEQAPDYRQPDALPKAEPLADPLEAHLQRAFAERPDLKMLEDDARAAGAEVTEYKSDYLPTLGAAAGVNTRGQTATPGTNFYAGLVVSWPIFNGFLTDHEAAEARLRQDAVRHAIEDLRQRVVLDVQRSYLDCQASLERIREADQTLAASRVELDLATKRYETGLGSIIELTDAQRRFTEDGAAYVRALAGFSVARAALARDTGVGLPRG